MEARLTISIVDHIRHWQNSFPPNHITLIQHVDVWIHLMFKNNISIHLHHFDMNWMNFVMNTCEIRNLKISVDIFFSRIEMRNNVVVMHTSTTATWDKHFLCRWWHVHQNGACCRCAYNINFCYAVFSTLYVLNHSIRHLWRYYRLNILALDFSECAPFFMPGTVHLCWPLQNWVSLGKPTPDSVWSSRSIMSIRHNSKRQRGFNYYDANLFSLEFGFIMTVSQKPLIWKWIWGTSKLPSF